MREILFRGKSVSSNDWIYGSLLVSNSGLLQDSREYMIWTVNIEKYHVLPESIGQFTGLIDKNGKQIFEGDILSDGAVVEWFDSLSWDGGGSNHSGFYCKKWFGYWRDGDLEYHNMFNSETEIIGNVFDNPELANHHE